MAINILGFTIGGVLALSLLIIGLIGLFAKRTLGQTIRGVLGVIPIGSPKLWSAIILVIGIMAGGWAVGMSYVQSGVSTASLGIGDSDVSSVEPAMLDCKFSTYGVTPIDRNESLSLDSSDNSHLLIILPNGTASGDASINGTLSCDSDRANIRQGSVANCEYRVSGFRSKVSTTDSNTYYIVATSTSASAISGYPWQLTAYLNDNAVATTSSDQEKTKLVFAQDEASQDLGFYFTLSGDTVLNYLREDIDPQDVSIVCDGVEQARITITKDAQ